MSNSKQVCAVLFDFGQVLTLPPDLEYWGRMKSITGLNEEAFSTGYWKYRHAYDRGDLNAIPYWQQIAADNSFTLSEESLKGLIDADVHLWSRLNMPMVDWAQALQNSGIKTGILSNIGDAMALGLRTRFDWIADFHHAVWSHEHNLAKPEPEIYLRAAQGLGCEPSQVLFVDDKIENIQAAHNVGMQAIQYDLNDHAAFERSLVTNGFEKLLTLQS